MKYLYVVSLLDNQQRMVVYRVVASTMEQAIAWAQEKAGVINEEPKSVQQMSPIDGEV